MMHSPAGLSAVLCVCVLFVLLGVHRRLTDHCNEFYLAGRSASSARVAMSIIATCLGASNTLGIAALAWREGWSAVLWLVSGAVGLVLLGAVWARAMRTRPETMSLPEWLGHTYGPEARRLAAALITVMWIAVVAAQWVAAGALIHQLAGLNLVVGMTLCAGTVALYTAIGGQESVLRTDLIQAVWALFALGVCLFASLRIRTGCPPPPPTLPDIFGNTPSTMLQRAAMIWVLAGMYIVGPDICSRILTARDVGAARRAAFLAAPVLAIVAVLLVLPGIRMRSAGIPLANPRDALPLLLTSPNWIPPAIGILAMLGLLAAVLSSADTCLLTIATVVNMDLRRKREVAHGRMIVVLAAAAALIVAIFSPRIIPNLMAAYAFYCGGLLVPLLLLAWPKWTARVPNIAVIIAILVGGSTPMACKLLSPHWETYTSAAVGNAIAAGIIFIGGLWRRPART